ncbi:hypothetical protein E2P81_ATG09769 [Venturia nashicola]|uniref:Uncharacterized protein n=1 Tax=Venturia nashicola TaxID=86259 RepID=A0A4Z1NBX9_9PEZI|nr:hypothetical protein E6O75_ATG09985 [Venturia nashicola]TLD14779.1 hypothetical protein E2P81_ATG09769 [Venturia nashicola]
MHFLASLALLASLISALPIDSTTPTSAVTDTTSATVNSSILAKASTQGKEEASDYGPPRGGGRDNYNYSYNYGPSAPPYPYQGGGYIPGQYSPPAPRPYGNGYNGGGRAGSSISNGVGEIAEGVGQVIGGTTAGLLGAVPGELLHGFEAGAGGGRRGYKIRRFVRSLFGRE